MIKHHDPEGLREEFILVSSLRIGRAHNGVEGTVAGSWIRKWKEWLLQIHNDSGGSRLEVE